MGSPNSGTCARGGQCTFEGQSDQGGTRLKVNDAKRVRFLTKEECRQLLAASPSEFDPIYFTYLNTGMRKLEPINMEWADIDLERRKIMARPKEVRRPKTGDREIPINGQLLNLLQ